MHIDKGTNGKRLLPLSLCDCIILCNTDDAHLFIHDLTHGTTGWVTLKGQSPWTHLIEK